MKEVMQWVALVWVFLTWLSMVWNSLNGRKAVEPSGFWGVLVSLVFVAIALLMGYCTGNYSEILGEMWP